MSCEDELLEDVVRLVDAIEGRIEHGEITLTGDGTAVRIPGVEGHRPHRRIGPVLEAAGYRVETHNWSRSGPHILVRAPLAS